MRNHGLGARLCVETDIDKFSWLTPVVSAVLINHCRIRNAFFPAEQPQSGGAIMLGLGEKSVS